MQIHEKTFSTEEGSVHYWVTRNPALDKPWLVFLPGLTADHTLFGPQLEYFKEKANVLAWDAPAHGRSRPYPLSFSLDDYACILHDILAMEGVRHPVLIGQSLGGYVSQAYMQLYPGSVAGFVSIDSAPLKQGYVADWELWLLKHTKLMYAAIPWKMLQGWGSRGTAMSDAGRANMLSMMNQYEHAEYAALASHGFVMLAGAIEAKRPYEIDCPALLLCGEKDAAGSGKRYNRAWTKREGIPLVWVPNAGHNSNIDAPDFVNDQIDQFLLSISSF